MPIISLDHLIRRTTTGFSYRADWNLTNNIAGVAARWMDMSRAGIHPSPNLYPATNGSLTWVDCNSSSGFGLPLGPMPDFPQTKHVFMASAVATVTTGVPSVLTLVDLQGYWPDISLTTTSPQTLSGTPNLRYNNGCLPYFVVTTTTGSTSQSLTISYTNQSDTTGRGLPFPYAIALATSVGYIYNASAGVPWYLPLSGSDTGVKNVSSVAWSATNTAGQVALCLAKPLLSIPITTLGNMVERDYVNQLPSLPEIKNEACLVWLLHPGASTVINSNFYGSLEYVWG